MPTVRTVFQPSVELEVTEAEHASLLAQGLVHDPDATAAAPAATAQAQAASPTPTATASTAKDAS